MTPESMEAVAQKMGLPLRAVDLIRPPKETQVFKYHMDYGTLTTNEIRARLGLPPALVGGDEPPEPVAQPPSAGGQDI